MGRKPAEEETEKASSAYRLLPSVEELLQGGHAGPAAGQLAREVQARLVREVLDGWREAIRTGALGADELAKRLEQGRLDAELAERVARERRAGVVPAVNATGVVLHTGLGRAPLHPEVARAMADAAASYCILEVDRESGRRNQRDERLSELFTRLLGSEAAIVVNNNAAAVYLVLNTFLERGIRDEVIVSRGELVEIGGSFRVPAVMERAGVVLKEVGTTNRTRIEDYRAAIGSKGPIIPEPRSSTRTRPRACARSARAFRSGCSVNPSMRKFERCTRRITAVSGPMTRS